MPLTPELVVDARCQIAEGPVWHPDERCLYWTDIPAGKIYRFAPTTGEVELVYDGNPVGGITVQTNGALLLLGGGGRVQRWRDGQITEVIAGIPEAARTRFNDVIADPLGRVIGGTMAERNGAGEIVQDGRLYALEPNGEIRTLLEGMGSPNGMGFTANHRQMYLTDSIAGVQTIFRFDYDVASGTLSNRCEFHQTPLDGSDGRPDGLTVDADDWIWSARWDGAVVVRLDPNGVERERYPLPVAKVTSLTFGGPEYADLYITTASGDDPAADPPGAGGLFRLRTRTRGRPEFRSCVGPG